MNVECKFFKVLEDFEYKSEYYSWSYKKNRIFMFVNYKINQKINDYRGNPVFHYYRYSWVLATNSDPVIYSFSGFDELQKQNLVQEVDILNEQWIYPHLHKTAINFINQAKILQREMIIEKIKNL